jgi:3-methyladenine DNA glycosylase AlkD
MKLDDVMRELAKKGTPNYKKTMLRHGAVEPIFGVKISDLKPLHRTLKGDQKLALDLYATKNSDAMYLAGMIADGALMTTAQLNDWAKQASWEMIAGTTVPWVASEHPAGVELALKWIDSSRALTAVAGWATLSAIAATRADDQLPMETYAKLLDRCVSEIHAAPNRVRYAMNNFVISCGAYLEPLAEKALSAARKIGAVEVDMGETACQVPEAESYIIKSRRGKAVAPKRKTVRC